MATSCGDSTPIIRTPQENDPSELDFKCRGLNKSDTGSSLPKPLPQKDENEVIGDVENFGIQFELHYDLSGRNTTEILQDILWEMSWRTPVHNWDIKIVPDSMSVLAMKGRQYLKANPLSHSLGLSTLTSYSTVEEILYHGGICERLPASEGSNDIARHMFFRKDAFKDNQSLFSFSKAVSNGDRALHGVCLQGRIIFIKEHVPHPQKDCLLLLYSLTIRLQYEEYGFIRAFIDRHLSLRTSVKMPYHWQETLPPELTSEKQICYRRVSVSCHIKYLKLDNIRGSSLQSDAMNHQQTSGSKGSGSGKIPLLNISEESSSTLLTIVIPEESVTKEEENGLLTDPNGLWTVLVVNGPPDFGSGLEPSHHLTPISQFLRGIVASLCTLRSNAQAIYRELKDLLALHDNNTIFDDENFTKSTLYHCTVKNCGEVVTCITSTLRFIRRTKKSHLDKLCRDAHAREKPGIDHWAREIEEEIFNLEDLKEEILALSAGVQESRNALHGATSVLEARLAAQQTHRMNTLAYLATLYIPLTASTSIYSMSVLPSAASFQSFFVVFGVLLLLTILLGANLQKMLAWVKIMAARVKSTPQMAPRLGVSKILPVWLQAYLTGYKKLLNPYETHIIPHPVLSKWLFPVRILFHLSRTGPILFLRHFLLSEICFPYDRYILFQYRHNEIVRVKFHFLFFIKDVVRFPFIPAWIATTAGLVVYFVVWDFMFGWLPKIFGIELDFISV